MGRPPDARLERFAGWLPGEFPRGWVVAALSRVGDVVGRFESGFVAPLATFGDSFVRFGVGGFVEVASRLVTIGGGFGLWFLLCVCGSTE